MKILIYRLSSIGDIVLTTPVVRCLRKTFPNAEIHFLTREKYKSVLSENPYINKVLCVEKSPKEIIEQLRNEKYDYFIDLHRNIRSLKTKRRLRTKYLTFPKLNLRKFLLTSLKINALPNIHIVHRYFKAVNSLGVKYDKLGLDFFINPKIETKNITDPNTDYIVIAIGGTFATKRYPAKYLAEVVTSLKTKAYIIGGNAEIEDGNLIANASSNAISLCGKISLQESARLIEKSKMVICNDTGMMHFAAALKKPIISIWGNTVPAFGMYQFYPDGMENLGIIIENKKLKCRPCSKLGHKACPKKHFKCMNDICPQTIISAIEELSKRIENK